LRRETFNTAAPPDLPRTPWRVAGGCRNCDDAHTAIKET
jgi:hypothetical protein